MVAMLSYGAGACLGVESLALTNWRDCDCAQPSSGGCLALGWGRGLGEF